MREHETGKYFRISLDFFRSFVVRLSFVLHTK